MKLTLISTVAALGCLCADANTAAAQSAYTLRHSAAVRGNYSVTGNGLVQCPTSTSCINNETGLIPIDIDDATIGDRNGDTVDDTLVSSSAVLTLPDATEVATAILYLRMYATATVEVMNYDWASPELADWPALFAPPGAPYQEITPSGLEIDSEGSGAIVRYDVTRLVTGSGSYTVGGVTLPPAEALYNRLGYWTLVVIYRDGGTMRLINVYDGLALCTNTPGLSAGPVAVSGFRTPSVGTVSARFTTWSGDGNPSGTGDSVQVGTVYMSNGVNPMNNIGNGTISDETGAIVRNPSRLFLAEPNDVDTFSASAAFTNAQTDTTFTYTCGMMDGLWYTGAALAIDVTAPIVTAEKSVADLNGEQLVVGDELQYTFVVNVTDGDDAADVRVTDAIPTGTEYVENSLEIEVDDAWTSVTDDATDDQGYCDGSLVGFFLGTGATGELGGEIPVGQHARARFRVRVLPTITPAEIRNVGTVSFLGAARGTGDVRVEVPTEASGTGGPVVVEALPCTDWSEDTGCPIADAGLLADAGAGADAGFILDGGNISQDVGGVLSEDTASGCGCRLSKPRPRAGKLGYELIALLALARILKRKASKP